MKTKSVILGLVMFFFVLAWGAVISWLSGYDFSSRNPGVGYGAAMISLLSVLVGAVTACAHGEMSKP